MDPRVQPYGGATGGLAHLRQLLMHAASHVYAPGAGVALGCGGDSLGLTIVSTGDRIRKSGNMEQTKLAENKFGKKGAGW